IPANNEGIDWIVETSLAAWDQEVFVCSGQKGGKKGGGKRRQKGGGKRRKKGGFSM
ncbi:MAG: hypothetical protein SGILL_008696, partial [Bacillariaceae sp.]